MVLSATLRSKEKESKVSVDDLKKYFRYENGKLFTGSKEIIGSSHHTGYRWVSYKGNKFAFSRVVFAINNGRWPNGVIDHINGIKDDNRIENLRDVCERVNQLNHPHHREEDVFPGVSNRNGKDGRAKQWRAIAPAKFLNRDADKLRHIRSFHTKEEAIIAVMSFCLLGDFDGLNETTTNRNSLNH